MPVSEATYARLALEDPEGQWELVCGRPRSKPGMTFEHNHAQEMLHYLLVSQLGINEFAVRENTRLRISTGTYYIPDICAVPRTSERRKAREEPGRLEV